MDIEKFTNGADADAAPGPGVIAGSTVNWTYVVSNTGSRTLTNISVTDDQGVTVTCPATTLDAGFSFTCTASGTAISGQYTNLGTVTADLPDSSTVTDSDPSHYFGQAALSVSIEKRTNGFDADTPPGPALPPGSSVNWDYVITNIGSETLVSIVVADDQGVVVTCPATTLATGMSMTCTGSGIAQPGQYANTGSVTATLAVSNTSVSASELSHYFGRGLFVVKRTNGIDVAAPPGPSVSPGSTVNWTYEITNPGPENVTGLTVTDDQGVTVTCPQTTLADDETITCSGSGIAEPGQYTNVAMATATLPLGGTLSGTDTSYYFGDEISIQKSTNGADADTTPGPSIIAGDPVNWTYVVTNISSGPLTSVTVTDDQGVTVTCPGTTLAPSASMTCTASGVATLGQYTNIGKVTAQNTALATLTATDPSHYFGQPLILDFGDAADPTYPSLLASNGARHILGASVFLGACVDGESDALASAAADGDDASAGTPFGNCAVAGDDEDGVTFTVVRRGSAATVDVVASAPCVLSAWIDFGADGGWNEPGDAIFPGGTSLAAGNNSLAFTVPAGATPGSTLSRFRCTTAGATTPTGVASDGEVEDHRVTIADALPNVSATKTVVLFADFDNDGLADPGDTLRYTIIVTNDGLADATSVQFSDTPDPNTSLVAGSVTSSAGTVTSGNTPGNTTVAVSIGTLAANGGTATIAFNVTIDNPFPQNVTQVVNSGTVSGTNIPTEATDDPTVTGTANPTAFVVSAVVPVPTLEAWALVALLAMMSAVAISRLR